MAIDGRLKSNTCKAHNQQRSHNLEELRNLQKRIAPKVILEDFLQRQIQSVTGFDVAYDDDEAFVAAVTMNYETLTVKEEKTSTEHVSFPYIPTFLSFREGPLVIKLASKLRLEPDVLMINAHGIAHPFFCGCASYVGVSVKKPTIGVAGSKLCGDYDAEPGKEGEWVPIIYNGRTVGAVLLSRQGSKPIFVSVGHMMTLDSALKTVNHFVAQHRFPEPLRLAHVLANRVRRKRKVDRSF